MRLAANDPDAAATALRAKWEALLPPELAAWAWAAVAKQAAIKLLPDASEHYQRAALLAGKAVVEIDWADDTLAWKARAALRANEGRPRWQQVLQAINAMGQAEQRDPAWVYWKARALQALAKDSSEPEAMTAQAQEMLSQLSGQLHFYGALAAEDLGLPIALPPAPMPLTEAERQAAAREPGFRRALQLIAIGLRNEGVREWNFTLRGLDDRALLAAAQLACDREVWDRCINSSDRTRQEIDLSQRFPTPFRKELQARARDAGLDPAYVYGLIRQESRFVTDARSGVGASGLMQVMPATARWTARKIGLPFTQDMITDRDVNLKIGTQYLKLVLDDFEGSQPLAAAAYNAGPGRPRRWREGPVLEAAIWAENVPFSETRDYVKKVLSNSVIYAALLQNPQATQAPSLKARLGRMIGPRSGAAPALDKELP
jgi:soluble lytic murein transglycosylase